MRNTRIRKKREFDHEEARFFPEAGRRNLRLSIVITRIFQMILERRKSENSFPLSSSYIFHHDMSLRVSVVVEFMYTCDYLTPLISAVTAALRANSTLSSSPLPHPSLQLLNSIRFLLRPEGLNYCHYIQLRPCGTNELYTRAYCRDKVEHMEAIRLRLT